MIINTQLAYHAKMTWITSGEIPYLIVAVMSLSVLRYVTQQNKLWPLSSDALLKTGSYFLWSRCRWPDLHLATLCKYEFLSDMVICFSFEKNIWRTVSAQSEPSLLPLNQQGQFKGKWTFHRELYMGKFRENKACRAKPLGYTIRRKIKVCYYKT